MTDKTTKTGGELIKLTLSVVLAAIIFSAMGPSSARAAQEWLDVVKDTRVTSDSNDSHNPSMGIDNSGNIHIAWQDNRAGDDNIYYTKLSGIDGSTLVDDQIITPDDDYSAYDPSLCVDSSGNVHIVWRDNRNGDDNIYYTKLSGSDGSTLVDDLRITPDDDYHAYEPSIGVDNSGNVHIAWQDNRTGNDNIYYTKLSGIDGSTLIDDLRITPDDDYHAFEPSIGVDNSGNVHIAWQEDRTGDENIYYTKLNGSNGATMIDDLMITPDDNNNAVNPSLSVDSSGNVHIAWKAYPDVYYTKLDGSNGTTLVDDLQITPNDNDNIYNPSLAVDISGNVHIAWEDSRGYVDEIYYTKLSGIDGATLEEDTRITPEDGYESEDPCLLVDSVGNVHIVWEDNRDGNQEIYYTKGCNLFGTDNHYPLDGANAPTGSLLSWADSGADSYDVYFGTDNPPTTLICDDITSTSCDPGVLAMDTHYYWQVYATNDCGTSSTISEFTVSCTSGITYYRDSDEDGRGDPDTSVVACSAPAGYVGNNGDCDDSDNTIYAGAAEVCDGKDNDCDGKTDELACVAWSDKIDELIITIDGNYDAFRPSVSTDSSGNVHIAWQDNRTGNHNIYYAKLSGIDGTKIVGDIPITSNPEHNVFMPSLAVDSSDNVHIAWQDSRFGGYIIYYSKLNGSDGTKLVDNLRITSGGSRFAYFPSLAVDSTDTAHIAWHENRSGKYIFDIYYAKLEGIVSTPEDDILIEAVRITPDDEYDAARASLYVDSSDNVHIAWQDQRDGENNIYYSKLNGSNGATLVDDTRITPVDGYHATTPSLSVDSSGNVHIAWQEYRNYNYNIYYTKLDGSNGATMIDDLMISPDDSYYAFNPSLSVDISGNVHIAWRDKRDRDYNIYYTKLDGSDGATLTDDLRITPDDDYDANFPSLAVDSSGKVHITWNELRETGNEEIYYTKGCDSPGIVDPTPLDGALVPVGTVLSWTGLEAEGYDVYFGTDNPPTTMICDDITSPHCDPGALAMDTHYFWHVDATNNCGTSTSRLEFTVSCTTGNIYYKDHDADGHGDPGISTEACSAPAGYVGNNDDCNDSDNTIYAGAAELCDGKDNDCDGVIDNNNCESWNEVLEDILISSEDNTRSYNPSMVVDNSDNVHIAWHNNDPPEIYYTKLDFNGNTLVNKARLTDDDGYRSQRPSLGTDSSGNIHMAWHDERDGNQEIYYKKLNSAGEVVVQDTRITSADYRSKYPRLEVDSSDNVHIAWVDQRDAANYQEIYYTKLDNSGNTLVDDLRVTHLGNSKNDFPDMAVDSSGNVHIVWCTDRHYDATDIFYTKLDGSNGATLVDDIRVTPVDGFHSKRPSIDVDSSGNVHIAWQDKRHDIDNRDAEIYYSKLNGSSGATLVDDLMITPDDGLPGKRPNLKVDNSGNVHIAWIDYRHDRDNADIYYTKLNNNGVKILNDTRLTQNVDYDANSPRLGIDSSGNIHLVWTDNRWNDDVYYKKGCNLPAIPVNPSPVDGSVGEPPEVVLDWDDAGGADTYDVLLDEFSPPTTTVCDDVTGSNCSPNITFEAGVTYYWLVVPINGCGSREGIIWSFTICDILNTYYRDADGDSYGDPNVTIASCAAAPVGYVANYSDCNDDPLNKGALQYPGREETCDGLDNNCDNNIDEGGDTLCDDSQFCNGTESCDGINKCQSGTAPDCDDGVGCTDDSCNEGTDSCDNIANNLACDDGAWCNGSETCDTVNGCQAGIAPNCDDNVGCTVDSCNEITDSCKNIANNAVCDDGDICTDNICDPIADCSYPPISCETTPTPAGGGSPVSISVSDCDITFDDVTSGGETTVAKSSIGTDPPSGFKVANQYYTVTTTADFTGTVEICFNYDGTGLTEAEESNLYILHFNTDTGSWENVTTYLDTANDVICGEVTGFSEFALAIPADSDNDDDGDGFGATIDCDNTNPNIHPGAIEKCDGVDNDCDSEIDENACWCEASVDIKPETLNRKSKGKWITVYIELSDCDINNIEITDILLNASVQAQPRPTEIGDYDKDGIPDLMVKFNRKSVIGLVEPVDSVTLTVTGALNDGMKFEADGSIKIIH